jgi:enoyl-CoA hydratase/carnithine racemase
MREAVPPPLERAEKDDNVRMAVFSGEGEKAFVSGADISQFEDMRAAMAVARYEQMAEAALEGKWGQTPINLIATHRYAVINFNGV